MAYQAARNGRPYTEPMGLGATLRWVFKAVDKPGSPYRVGAREFNTRPGMILHLRGRLTEAAWGKVVHVFAGPPLVEFLVRKVAPQPSGTIGTRYGFIYPVVGPCTEPKNLVTFTSKAGDRVTLQEPAKRSFQAVERTYGEFRITGSIRDCAYQASLYAKDPARYAHPDKTAHTRGLAIDVHTADLTPRLVSHLENEGWNRSRPDDEPWHASFGVTT